MDLAIAHKNLWAWLAEDPSRSKDDWPGFMELDTVKNECFACEHADKVGNGNDTDICEYCPLAVGAKKFLGNNYDDSDCLGGLYSAFTRARYVYRMSLDLGEPTETVAKNKDMAQQLAIAIRDLEWKD